MSEDIFYDDGVPYATTSVLHGEADEVTCLRNGGKGGWDVEVSWKCKMGIKKYWAYTLGKVLKKAAQDRVKWGRRGNEYK